MTTILRLVRIDFDNLENDAASTQAHVQTFVDTPTEAAVMQARAWFDAQPPTRFYVGYDHGVYPQFRLFTEYAK